MIQEINTPHHMLVISMMHVIMLSFTTGSLWASTLIMALVWLALYIFCCITNHQLNKSIQEQNQKESDLTLKLLLAIYSQTQKPLLYQVGIWIMGIGAGISIGKLIGERTK